MTDRIAAARFILVEAAKLGIRIGTDGDNLLISPPRGLPNEIYFPIQRAVRKHHDEIIQIIQREET